MTLDPRVLELLSDPETHDPLELGDNCLINPKSGQSYPIREGIAVFLQEASGRNRKYQTMYDRLAPGYDLAERLFYWISRKPDRRLGFIPELEVPARASWKYRWAPVATCPFFARTSSSSASICRGACCADAATT